MYVRYEMLQDNVEGYRKEIASLNEKSQKQAAAIQQSEQIIHTLTQDLRATAEKLSIAQVSQLTHSLKCRCLCSVQEFSLNCINHLSLYQSEAENLRKERDMLKMVEIRLTQEKESFKAQQLGQNMLLTNLKSIQVTSTFTK